MAGCHISYLVYFIIAFVMLIACHIVNRIFWFGAAVDNFSLENGMLLFTNMGKL